MTLNSTSTTRVYNLAMAELTEKQTVSDRTLKFDDVLTLAGIGKFNLFLLFATGICLMSVIMETMGMMYVMPVAECDFKLTLTMKGYLSSANFLGVVLSSQLWGFFGDMYGRRRILMISMLSSFIVTLISSIVPEGWMFILLRFINGLLIGGASAIVYVFNGEFHNDRYRPKVLSWMSAFVAIANMVLAGLAWLILPAQWSFELPILNIFFKPWRLLVISYGLPSLISGICVIMLPESPKYLLIKGKEEEALLTLQKMFTLNAGKSSTEFPVKHLLLDEDLNHDINHGFFYLVWKQTVLLFKSRFVFKTILVCMLQFGVFMTSTGFNMWYPDLMNAMTIYENDNPGTKTTVCSGIEYKSINKQLSINATAEASCTETIEPEVFIVCLILGSFLTVVYITIGSFINIVGKKNVLLLLFVISASSGLAAQYLHGSILVKLFMIVALIASTSVGVINTLVVDIYPTHVRAMALGMSLMFGRFGAVTGSHLSGYIFYHICNFSYPIFATIQIVLVIIVLLLSTSSKTTKMVDTIS